MYIWSFLKLFVVFFFFVESLPNPVAMQNCSTGQLAKPGKYYQQKTLASIINKKPKLKKKWLPVGCSHQFPLWHEHRHWDIGIPGIPSDLWSRPKQFHYLLGALLPSDYRQHTVANGCLHIQLYRKGAYFHYLWLYFQIMAKKVWYLTKYIPLASYFVYLATPAKCAGSINWTTAVKGLRKWRT